MTFIYSLSFKGLTNSQVVNPIALYMLRSACELMIFIMMTIDFHDLMIEYKAQNEYI